MAPSFGEVLGTKLFTFLIGPEETSVTVHAGVIARLSGPLDSLVNGQMREARDNVARFPDLEAEDFQRICEFAYRGIYTNPKPKPFSEAEVDVSTHTSRLADPIMGVLSREGSGSEDDRSEDDGSEDEGSEHEETSHDTKVFMTPKSAFWGVKNPHPKARLEWPAVFSNNKSWRDNFAPVFLGHARLYAFAEQYLVTALKDDALENIRQTLGGYTLFTSGLEAVIQLARFAYDGDFIPDRWGEVVDPLRQIVVAYITVHQKHFRNYPGHRQLLEAHNEYAVDFLDFVTNWFNPDTIQQRADEAD